MATKRKPTVLTTEAIDQYCAAFDDLFARDEERTALRQELIGLPLPLLLPLLREHNKTNTTRRWSNWGSSCRGPSCRGPTGRRCTTACTTRPPGPWEAEALNRRRLERWQAHPYLGPQAGGVLIVDEPAIPSAGSASSWRPSNTWASWGAGAMWPTGRWR